MAFTTPATVVAATAATASYANTYIRDNIAWLATDSPTCRAYRTTLLSTTTATLTTVNLDSERFDNAAMHSTSVNTSRITIPTGGGGKYMFGGLLEFANNGTGLRQIIILRSGTDELTWGPGPGDASATCPLCTTAQWAFSAGDYIELRGYQNSGGNLNIIVSGGRNPELWAAWSRT